MTTELVALLTHARSAPASERARIAAAWTQDERAGTVLVSTCHRVELYGTADTLDDDATDAGDHVRVARGSDVIRHLATMAVGRDSTVLGEDQILHQLRVAVQDARRRRGVVPELDRAIDVALRAGRRARSWMPANRPTLVDLALERASGSQRMDGARVHVAGAGEMGRYALAALTRRGARATVGSRTREHARAVGGRVGAADVDFDPGADLLAATTGVVVALAGEWPLSLESRQALIGSDAWVIDLSAPPAVDAELMSALGDRIVTIDDLGVGPGPSPSARTLARLDVLIDETVAIYEKWAADRTQHATADALARRAGELQSDELDRLWRRLPTLDQSERAEVERAVAHLTQRLLSDPLEQLGRDHDGSRARAARELFRL